MDVNLNEMNEKSMNNTQEHLWHIFEWTYKFTRYVKSICEYNNIVLEIMAWKLNTDCRLAILSIDIVDSSIVTYRILIFGIIASVSTKSSLLVFRPLVLLFWEEYVTHRHPFNLHTCICHSVTNMPMKSESSDDVPENFDFLHKNSIIEILNEAFYALRMNNIQTYTSNKQHGLSTIRIILKIR